MTRARSVGPAIAAALIAVAPGARGDDPAIARVRDTPAGVFAPGLPTASLAAWLRRELPRSATVSWAINDCGEQTGDAASDAGRVFPTCVGARIELPSRDRVIDLLFASDPPAYITGAMDSPSAAAPRELATLADLTDAMGRSLALLGLGCLDGDPTVVAVYAGATESCYRGDILDGPYRSWFHTGLYLMEKGSYRDGVKVDRWIACDRFERCEAITYDETGAAVARNQLGSGS